MATRPTPLFQAGPLTLWGAAFKRPVIQVLAGGFPNPNSPSEPLTLQITKQQSGSVFIIEADAQVLSLPIIADGDRNEWTTGVHYWFVNGLAAGAALVTVTSDAASAIVGTIGSGTGGTNFNLFTSNGALANSVKNTKATALAGDWVHLMSDGTSVWRIIGGTGIWTN